MFGLWQTLTTPWPFRSTCEGKRIRPFHVFISPAPFLFFGVLAAFFSICVWMVLSSSATASGLGWFNMVTNPQSGRAQHAPLALTFIPSSGQVVHSGFF
jgi:hypothetical protein